MARIILFNNALSGGGGKYITTIAQAMHKKNIDVHIVIYEEKIDFEIPEEIPLHLLSDHDGKKGRIIHQLKQTIALLEPIDLIVSNSSPSNKILTRLKHPKSIHCIHSAETKRHHGILAPIKRWWRREKYRRLYDGKDLITVSKGLESFILDELKASPASIRTIYNPFDFDAIKKAATVSDPKIPSEPYIVHVGRFDVASKRHDILLRAFLKANIPHKLVLVGDGKDRQIIERWVRDYRLEDKVIMAGFQSNPYPWIAKASLLVSSSDFEGFGRTLVEALILGTPVVSTDCPSGPSDILIGALKEFLSPPGDPKGLALCINSALTFYPDISNDIINRFKSNNIVNKYKQIKLRNDGR